MSVDQIFIQGVVQGFISTGYTPEMAEKITEQMFGDSNEEAKK